MVLIEDFTVIVMQHSVECLVLAVQCNENKCAVRQQHDFCCFVCETIITFDNNLQIIKATMESLDVDLTKTCPSQKPFLNNLTLQCLVSTERSHILKQPCSFYQMLCKTLRETSRIERNQLHEWFKGSLTTVFFICIYFLRD